MNNIIKAVFGGRREARTASLYQWDYGIILQFIGPNLPAAYEVHFSTSLTGEAAVQIGDEDGVLIPDEYLTTAGILYAWVYLHTGDSDGETRYTVTIPVTPRAKPTDYEPTPVEQSVISQTIAALTAGVAAVEEAVENVDQTVADALQEAKDSGEFDGPKGDTGEKGDPGSDGVSPTVQVTEITGGHKVTVTDAAGSRSFDVMDGPKGDKGDPGETGSAGSDGVSPTVQVSAITGGHRVTVTDATGAHTFDVMDGEQGAPGATGATGNGIASIVKTGTSGLVDTYTITYTDGTSTTYTVTNGAQGQQGPQGVPGSDYVLTAQDKADIADIVLSELPTATGVNF